MDTAETVGQSLNKGETPQEDIVEEAARGVGINTAGTVGRNVMREGATDREGDTRTERDVAGTSRGGKTTRKQKQDNMESLLHYLSERDKQRQDQHKMLITYPNPDIDGVDYFCAHIKSILTKLTPTLRVEAKTKVFHLLSEYELKSVQQTERSSFLQDSTSSSYFQCHVHYLTHSLLFPN